MNRTLVLLLMTTCVVGCDKLLYNEKTIYAPGYSDRRFRRVQIGMTENDVIALLGQPLNVITQKWSESWFYFRPVNSSTNRHLLSTTYTFGVSDKVTELSYNPQGTVTNVSGDYLAGDFLNLDKERVRSKAGEPSRIDLRRGRIFRYTLPGPSGSYKVRQIDLDESNRVFRITAEMRYD